MNSYDTLVEKWAPVLNENSSGEIKDAHRRSVTAAILENQEIAMNAERAQSQGFGGLNEAAPGNATSSASNWDPVLISLVRRAMPNLMAYDVCGVQPMSGPTGLIFAMKARYGAGATGSREALFNEAETQFSGDRSTNHDSDNASGFNGITDDSATGVRTVDSSVDDSRLTSTFGSGMSTAAAEALGDGVGAPFAEMGFTIEKATVTAKSRALKAEYSLELAQDLKAIHGLDAEGELATILSSEILAEINREIVRTVNRTAKLGALQASATVKGIFNMDTDSDGRWLAEKAKGLIVQIEREANVIAKETRRGKGNYVICSSDVGSVLAASGMLDYSPALATNLNVDDTGNTFAGVLNGKFKVYVDPYATGDYVCVGYRGTTPYDAGVFYCPYVPLTMVKAIGEEDFQPRIGFKTRYGMVANPFVATDGTVGADRANPYFRIFRVDGIMASA